MRGKILISGGGIAGLTLAILLKRKGMHPVVLERAPKLREEGYMMDFFGSGWDVAERMGIVEDIQAVKYPIDAFRYVREDGRPIFHMPVEWARQGQGGNYTYIRRQDLERILFDHSQREGVEVRFRSSIATLEDRGNDVLVGFEDGTEEVVSIVVGADGIASRVRELVFGPYESYAKFLGSYVAAFQAEHAFDLQNTFSLYEEKDRLGGFYPISNKLMDATYVFRDVYHGFIPPEERLPLLQGKFKGCGWMLDNVLQDLHPKTPLYFDAMTQIIMPSWHKGRVVLIGDAAGCLTLLAGQGSHMAMAGAYVLADCLEKYSSHNAGFDEYERFIKPIIDKKQKEARRLANLFVPSACSRPWLRRFVLKLLFSRIGIIFSFSLFGSKSILKGWK